MRERSVTLVDIAKIAGVSPITVSRVCRQTAIVSPETRERVLKAIDEAGYVPDRLAGGLAGARSSVAAIIVPTLETPSFLSTVRSLASRLEPEGLSLLLGETGYDPSVEEKLIREFLGYRPHGIVLFGTEHSPATERLLREAGIPVIAAWCLTDTPIGQSIGFSDFAASRELTLGFVAGGHTHIGFGARGADIGRASGRLAGYLSAMEAAGLSPVVVSQPMEVPVLKAGAALLEDLLQDAPETQAAIFSSDTLAAGAVFQCQRLGLRIPEDLEVAGFGNLEIGEALVPPLTTVQVPSEEMGEHAARLILEGKQTRGVTDLGYKILGRESSPSLRLNASTFQRENPK